MASRSRSFRAVWTARRTAVWAMVEMALAWRMRAISWADLVTRQVSMASLRESKSRPGE